MRSNPFPGLRPFKQEETHLFFGRDGQSQELLKRLQDSRFLALVGVSGSGKSSLIRAGLLPKLDGGLMSAVEADWRIAVFRPGDNPIGNMARALVVDAGLGGDSGLQDVEVAIAETTLRRGNLGLLELLDQAKRKVREDGRPFLGEKENVLVVVDQFEELFRIIEQYDDLVRVKQLSAGDSDVAATAATDNVNRHPREEASAFVKLLLESTKKNARNGYDENVYIIVTMRSDYLGDTAQFGGMPERINEGQYLIPRMDRDERRKAIVGPVAVAGGSIAEPLVNQLLNDAGEDSRQLPTLQHALMRMWDLAERTPQNGGLQVKHYNKIGKLSGALSQHANEAYDELSAEHQKLAAKIFKCLTEKGLANRETRRPMKIADICEVVGAEDKDVKTVVDCFRKDGRWFLMPPQHEKPELTSDTLVDIAHESLISGWNRLRVWVNEEAESARTYKRLADTAILKDLGREDFYRGPALQLALDWRKNNAPNPAWARRYHPEYAKADAFLTDSLKDTEKREKAEKDRTARELRRTRIYNIVLGILAVMFLVVGVFAVGLQQRMSNADLTRAKERADYQATQAATAVAGERRANELKKQAQDAQRVAEEERQKAEDAQQVAEDAAKRLSASLKTEQAAVAAARKAEALAKSQRDIAVRLQQENEEQATTYGYFKDAFDQVAERNYSDAITILRSGVTHFEEKERSATSDSDRQKSTTNKISAIINIADIHRTDGDPKTDGVAIEEYNTAIKLLGSSNNKLLAPTLMKAGSVWKESKDPKQAGRSAEYYETAASVYRQLGRRPDSSDAWVEAGKIHLTFLNEKALDKAVKDFNNAASSDFDEIFQALTNARIGESYVDLLSKEADSDKEEEEASADASRNAARIENRLREDGAKFFNDAAIAFDRSGVFKMSAEMQVKRGEILSESKSAKLIETAATAFRSASTYYLKDDASEAASVLVDGGETLLGNDNETAKSVGFALLEDAAKIDQKNPTQQAATLSQIGSIYAGLDPPQKDRALDYYQRAILLARDQKDRAAEVTAILAKASGIEELEIENGDAQLNKLYEQAIGVYNDDPVNKIRTIVKVGRAVLGRSDEEKKKAKEYFDAALKLAYEQPDKKVAGSANLEIGIAYRLTDRAKAAEHYQSALGIYEAQADLYAQAITLYRLASLPGPRSEDFTDRSLALFDRVMPTLETSGKQEERAEAFSALGYLYRRKKNYEQSLSNYERALLIYQSLKTLPEQKARVVNIKGLIRSTKRQMETR